MNAFVLYLVLLQATLTTFSGLASLPVLRADLVVRHRVLTDEQLNTAVVVTRTTPGPVGLYVVSVGYFVGGLPGAFAGWLAMCTPAFLILPLLRFAGRSTGNARARAMIRAVVFASAGLLWAATLPIAAAAIQDPLSLAILLASVVVLVRYHVEGVWVILAAALVQLAVAAARVLAGL